MKYLKQAGLLWIILLRAFTAMAQDHMYSQFFNSPVYLNPALNGQFDGDLRLNLIYRNQWTGLQDKLSYMTASIDYNIPRFGGGFGLMFTRSSEGTAYLNKNNISGIYSYSVGSDNFVLSFGLQAGITNRTINWNNLVFGDQIDPRLGYIPGSVSSAEMPQFNSRYYFDSGAGTNLVAGQLMIGAALQHINRPNESFTGAPAKLPVRLTSHLSYRLDLSPFDNEDEKSYLIPSVVFYKQAQARSFSAGIQFKRRSVNAGAWYRSGNMDGPSAIVVSFIFDLFIKKNGSSKLRFGISHDATTSKLNYTNTNGTTEGSLGYEIALPNSEEYSKFPGAVRCYEFY